MKMKEKTKEEIKVGLTFGLITWLIAGPMITFITQLIGLITSNPEFVMFDMILSGLLIVVIQIAGWVALNTASNRS